MFAQGPLLGKISEAEGFEEGVELRAVVGAVVVVADIGMSTKYIFCLFDINRFVKYAILFITLQKFISYEETLNFYLHFVSCALRMQFQ